MLNQECDVQEAPEGESQLNPWSRIQDEETLPLIQIRQSDNALMHFDDARSRGKSTGGAEA
jgi:hypothetical protein